MTETLIRRACQVGAILLLTIFIFAVWARLPADHSAGPVERISEPDIVAHVYGLACARCAQSVTNEMKKIDAVRDVRVLMESDQRVLLMLKEGRTVDGTMLREAVERAGFSTRTVDFADQTSSSS